MYFCSLYISPELRLGLAEQSKSSQRARRSVIPCGGRNPPFFALLPDSFLGLAVLHELNSESVDGVLKLMFTPSHACGIPAVLLGIIIWGRFSTRPSWPLAAFLGLWLGAPTLVAEWYFFLFIGAISLCSLVQAFSLVRHRRSRGHDARHLVARRPLTRRDRLGLFHTPMFQESSGTFG